MLHTLLLGVLLLPAAARQQTDTTFSAAGLAEVTVENMTGTTVIRGWDRDQVRVRARHDARVYLDIDASDGELDIEPDSERGAPGTVHLEIDVPARMVVDVEGVHSAITVEGIDGGVDAENVNGDVLVRGGRGDVDVVSVDGVVTIEQVTGRISAESVNNGVRIRNSTGAIDAETVNGPVLLEDVRSADVSASTVNGEVSYDGSIEDDGSYVLSSHNGEVVMRMPSGANATVMVSTFNGEFEVEFPVQVRDREARGRFQFQIGAGGARVELDSFGGNVRVLRTR